MRQGYNPNKDKPHEDTDYIHHVIIPVFIPKLDGYYKDGLRILQYCLNSLFVTVHPKTFITIVNNGSAAEVRDYLDNLFTNGLIHELTHTHNCGKLNAILMGISGHNFPLVTVSDADVLFLDGWQKATYDVFDHFPQAGAVSPTPSSRSYKTYTANIWFELLFSKALFFTKVQDVNALTAFAASIDHPDYYNKHHLSQYLTVSNQNVRAVVGAGHFVATYRSEVFNTLPKFANYKLGGDSELKILDIPVYKYGFWRLSTHKNFAKHMGNVEESWMQKEFPDKSNHEDYVPLKWVWEGQKRGSIYYVIVKVFSKVIFSRYLLKKFLRYKGLSEEAAKNY